MSKKKKHKKSDKNSALKTIVLITAIVDLLDKSTDLMEKVFKFIQNFFY